MSERVVGVLVMAYGTPRNTAEIEPYYTDIRRGRPPSAEQLADLTGRYAAIGGLSPLHERTEAQRDALATMPANTKVVFTAHSLPTRILGTGDPYPREVRATASAVAVAAGLGRWSGWSAAWQSAGRTADAWLGPDILEVIDDLGPAEHADGLLVCPCGFVADHLEVLFDLDVQARQRAEAAGLVFARTAVVNDDPGVTSALAALVAET